MRHENDAHCCQTTRAEGPPPRGPVPTTVMRNLTRINAALVAMLCALMACTDDPPAGSNDDDTTAETVEDATIQDVVAQDVVAQDVDVVEKDVAEPGEPDAATEDDAGGAVDAANATDAGSSTDTGNATDAGIDGSSGLTDAGGSAVDAGSSADASPDVLDDAQDDAGVDVPVAPKCKAGGCDDANVCTTDVCVPASGCKYTPNKMPCFDGDKCNGSDTCVAGKCVSGKDEHTCKDDEICTDDKCDPVKGCVFPLNTAKCDDGDPCTSPDVCNGGKCTPGKKAFCDDNNPCTQDSCQADADSGCSNKPIGGPCDDGSKCTTVDTCSAGKCIGSKQPVCEDANPCTDATCDPKSGCLFVPNKATCNDGNPCTGKDTCAGGSCKGVDVCVDLLPDTLGKSPCSLSGTLPKPAGIKLVPWFQGVVSGRSVIQLTHVPDGTDRVVIVDRHGRIEVFNNDRYVKTKKTMVDITSKVSTAGEGGLLSVAFHPKFKSNSRLFVNYTKKGVFETVVSRLVVNKSSGFAPSSSEVKLIVIKQPYSNHDGGQLFFDVTGKLLVGMGDGGAGGDPLNAGQDDATLLGKMLRLDVDIADPGKNYGVPKDNPKLTMKHAANWLPETWAKGLRNPWRFSRDRATGKVWVADVGQGKWEEVSLLEKGANYGWRLMEGHYCYNPKSGCKKPDLKDPIDSIPRHLAKSITGGYVYRGKSQPGLTGVYIFGDFVTGKFFGLRKVGDKWVRSQLLDSSFKVVSFGEDQQGELYATTFWGSRVARVERSGATSGSTFPLKLSQTKCFTDLKTLKPAAGALDFDVNAPLWSDGAQKYRNIVLPKGKGKKSKALGLPSNDAVSWEAPVGTIVIKSFALGPKGAGPAGQTKVETRFMVRDVAERWRFYTYAWREDGSDADLLLDGATRVYTLPGGGKQTWHVPSTGDCKQCHKGPKGMDLLGVTSAQLNSVAKFGAKSVDRLGVWNAAGLLNAYKGDGKHAAFPDQRDLKVPAANALDAHARAYLHVNCANCHRPGGNSNTDLDLRSYQALANTKACNTNPKKGALGVTGGKLLAPGKPEKSTIWLRMGLAETSGDFMPNTGVAKKHTAGIALLKAWISGLKACK